MLTNAAIEGNLDIRADAEKFNGAWKELVNGINNILENMATPLKDVIEVMDQISKGNLKVTTQGMRIPEHPDGNSGNIRTRNRRHPDTLPANLIVK
jgi:methyl-accepting chemotaxis protein